MSWKKVLVSGIAVIVAAVIGTVLAVVLNRETPIPQVISVGPAQAAPGQQVDIEGTSLDQV